MGVSRNLWFSVTRVKFVNLTRTARRRLSADGNDTKSPDFKMMFYNHRGTKDEPTPPPPPPTPPSPPIPPPRPVPNDKNITVSGLAFADRDGNKTFVMTQNQLEHLMRFPIHPGTGVTLNFQGTWQIDVGKTGIQLTLYDTYAEKTYF